MRSGKILAGILASVIALCAAVKPQINGILKIADTVSANTFLEPDKNADKIYDFRKGGSEDFQAIDADANIDYQDCCNYKENVTFDDNGLNLTIDKDRTGKYNYSAGRYQSYALFGYGYYETVMKAIKNNGVSTGFAIHDVNEDYLTFRDNFDIEFQVSGNDTKKVRLSWTDENGHSEPNICDLGFDASDGFHKYAFDYAEDHIAWYADGKEIYRLDMKYSPVKVKITTGVWPIVSGRNDFIHSYDGKTPLTATYKWITYTETGNYYLQHGDNYETFSNMDTIERIIGDDPATTYKPKLAHILSVMAASIYDELDDFTANYETMGFIDHKEYYCNKEFQEQNEDNVGFAFGKKKLSDGTTEVLITVRGTADSPLSLNKEWISDLKAGYNLDGDQYNLHEGFRIAADRLWHCLLDYLKDEIDSNTGYFKKNIRFILTGHSRGAAVANIIAHYLNVERVSPSQVYAYTFACPDTCFIGNGINYNTDALPNLFNISNAMDPVSTLPGNTTNFLSDFITGNWFNWKGNKGWNKFGKSYWFYDAWGAYNGIKDIVACAAVNHPPEKYIEFMRKELPITSEVYKTRAEMNQAGGSNLASPIIVGGVHCPVDVTFTDENGEILAAVVNNEINYTDEGLEKINIWIIDGHKLFSTNGDVKVNIQTNATDDGTMSVVYGELAANGNVCNNAVLYQNVPIKNGEKFELNNNDERSLTDMVLAAGDGTEILPSDSFLLGDVNKNNKVDAADIVAVQKYITNKTDFDDLQIYTCDMNGDGNINVFDDIALRRMVLNNQ